MALHAKAKGFETHQNKESILRRERSAGVAQWRDPTATDIGCSAERLSVDDAVIGGIRFIEDRKAIFVLGPIKLAGIDDDRRYIW